MRSLSKQNSMYNVHALLPKNNRKFNEMFSKWKYEGAVKRIDECHCNVLLFSTAVLVLPLFSFS